MHCSKLLVMMRALLHLGQPILRRLRRLTKDLLILPHTLGDMLLNVFLPPDRLGETFGLESSHTRGTLYRTASLFDGSSNISRRSGNLPNVHGDRGILAESLCELLERRID